MTKRQKRATTRTAARNITRATANAQRAAQLAATSARVIAHRLEGPATPLECTRMVAEKVLAAQTAWWSAGLALATGGARLAQPSRGRGPFALWDATLSISTQTTATILEAQRALMAPLWTAARANQVRLSKATRNAKR